MTITLAALDHERKTQEIAGRVTAARNSMGVYKAVLAKAMLELEKHTAYLFPDSDWVEAGGRPKE